MADSHKPLERRANPEGCQSAKDLPGLKNICVGILEQTAYCCRMLLSLVGHLESSFCSSVFTSLQFLSYVSDVVAQKEPDVADHDCI